MPAKLITKWPYSTLTWSLRNYSPRISAEESESIIQKAFDTWSQYTPLKIKRVCSTCLSNFAIAFAQGDHDDGYRFDGQGGTLAHAYFPIDGRIHLDVDEPWTSTFTDYNINLYLVAVHEIGHALGLDHVYEKSSIMYPSYQLKQERDMLPYYDRREIQALYGVPLRTTTPKPTPRTSTTLRRPTSKYTTKRSTTKYTTKPSPQTSKPNCRLFIDAAFDFPDKSFHTLDTGMLRRYLPNKGKWDTTVIPFQNIYHRLPNRISGGAYDYSTDRLFIFTSARVYLYKIHLPSHRVVFLRDDSLPTHLHSAIVGALFYQDGIYIVKAKSLQPLDIDNLQKKSNEIKLNSEFPGLSGSVKAAFTYGYLHHFFTRDGLVYVWDEQFNKWKTSAKPMDSNWFGCQKNL